MAKLFNCDCEYQKIENKVENSTAKGYILVSECVECAAKREADNSAHLVKEAEEKAIADLEAQRKESGKTKLLALGLSQEEIDALIK